MLNADKGLHGTFLVKAAQGKTCQHGAIVEGGAFVHGKRKQSPMELASRPTGDCNIVGGSGLKGRRPPDSRPFFRLHFPARPRDKLDMVLTTRAGRKSSQCLGWTRDLPCRK